MRIFTIGVVILFLGLQGCTHRISRSGYVPGIAAADCKTVIKKMAVFNDSSVVKVGRVRLGDTGFSTTCEESDALRILRQEACAADANIINIVTEQRADLISTCYRVEADLLRMTDAEMAATLVSDPEYRNLAVDLRVNKDSDRKVGMFVGYTVGTLVGIVVAGLLTAAISN